MRVQRMFDAVKEDRLDEVRRLVEQSQDRAVLGVRDPGKASTMLLAFSICGMCYHAWHVLRAILRDSVLKWSEPVGVCCGGRPDHDSAVSA